MKATILITIHNLSILALFYTQIHHLKAEHDTDLRFMAGFGLTQDDVALLNTLKEGYFSTTSNGKSTCDPKDRVLYYERLKFQYPHLDTAQIKVDNVGERGEGVHVKELIISIPSYCSP